MHYSRHHLTASVVYVTTRTYSWLVLLAQWLVRQKLNRVSSVQFSSVTSLCTRLDCWSQVPGSCTGAAVRGRSDRPAPARRARLPFSRPWHTASRDFRLDPAEQGGRGQCPFQARRLPVSSGQVDETSNALRQRSHSKTHLPWVLPACRQHRKYW